ncbi:MAG TPA: quinol:electron acceptor oxidoreductase subunit ActD [Kofleriaceae bacterium]|nr:quinol:electron acceptor oxidoreductase subunit ActD [Kofleriaceae bacterium]
MGEVKVKEKSDKKISVFGLFHDEESLGRAVDALKAAGYRNSDISALLPDRSTTKTFAHEKHTKTPEGAAAGATAGVAVGGTLGWLLGIGAIAIPGLGPFLAAGPLMAALAGAGVGAAAGTLTGALVGMGIPEYEAKRYESFINQGGALLSVHCDDSEWARKARNILDGFGGHDIDSAKEANAKGPTMERHRDVKIDR